ncbi:MAG: hypothetical protein KF752_01165 [Pirellulaceae bacterium]|nr:hypothetical protein [Pirellulaceae bacterium]
MAMPAAGNSYDRIKLLRLMFLSREGDRREGLLLRQGKGWFHVSGAGHEAMAAIAHCLEPTDYLFPYYRDRALMLARGLTNAQLASAFYAKRGSSSTGRQMPAHYSDRDLNIWSVPTPTGSQCLPACGVGWAMQLQAHPGVVLTTLGDAAARQGEFAEAVAFALERQLPVVFVVEDNHYGISTNTQRQNPFRLGLFGQQFVEHVDARHPDRVLATVAGAVQQARRGGGPSVIWAEVDRLSPHTSSDDHRIYRTPEDIQAMNSRDPIERLADELILAGQLTVTQWKSMQNEICQQVDREYAEAEAEPDPDPRELLHELVASAPNFTPPLPQAIEDSEPQRIVDALQQTFRAALQADRRVVMFGEDIQAPKGGVFGMTAGLSDDFPDRVFNSPLAEATIAGVAVGMACYGMKPVFEFQFIDFVGPALNQICNNLATLRWRSGGQWTCPAVLYAPYGAYLPGGSLWHSQANESLFAHLPGIRIAVPSTPEDTAGLLWSAINSHDPTLLLIPKHLLRHVQPAPNPLSVVEFGRARVRRAGQDVTLIAWGNCMELAEAAAQLLDGQIDVEVIDLRSIQPWDQATIAASVAKTGHLVVVQEDGQSCSVGQMIISHIASDPTSFYWLLGPPQLVSKIDVPIGYNPVYEFSALPDVSRIVAAIRLTREA